MGREMGGRGKEGKGAALGEGRGWGEGARAVAREMEMGGRDWEGRDRGGQGREEGEMVGREGRKVGCMPAASTPPPHRSQPHSASG